MRLRYLAVALLVAGCGSDPAPAPTPQPQAPAPTVTAAEPPADPNADTGSPAITSVTADPGDGTIMVGTGPALYRVAPGAKAERLTGTLTTPQGSGQVSGNLVVRFAGPGELLASGHPVGDGLPENLGLIRSKDHGETWAPVAQLGEADYHELEIAGKLIVGVKADEPDIVASRDGGRTWSKSTPPAAPIDVVVDPADAQHWAVSTEQGTFVSLNGGGSWRPRDTTFGARLAWPAPDALYSLDPNGKLRVSADGGRTWKDRGDAGGLPSEFSATKGVLYAGVVGGKVRASRDGGKSWRTVATLR